MSTTEDTSAIDEKKGEENEFTPNFKGFITNYLSSIVFTIGISIFVIGGLGLYTTKVAQSNILPDDIDLAPYTIIDRVVKDIPIDMNIMKPSFFADSNECLSQKAIFNSKEYLDSFNKSFLCSIKNNADPNAGLFANAPLYFSSVYDNLTAKNFMAINTIFFYLSYLPESLIMFLYGIFGIFLWMGLYFFNVCISIFYHFINIPQLFRDKSQENDKQWETTESISFLRFMKLILFFFIWLPIGMISTFVMPIFFTIYSIFAPLFATYEIKQTNKSYGVFDFVKDTFAYKKFFFFVLATLSLFSNGIKYLGNNAIVGIIIAVLFAYFIGLFSNEMPEAGVDGFTNKIRENIKSAVVMDVDLKNAKLVEICQRIPIDDEKMEKIIQNGKFRQLTKPQKVGGDNNVSDYMNTSQQQQVQQQQPSQQQQVQQQQSVQQQQQQQPVQQQQQPVQQQPSQQPVQQQQQQKLRELLEDLTNPIPNQKGGKKGKTQKKYNIRWT